MVGILKDAVLLMVGLIYEINTCLELDFMDVSSYGNATVSSGEIEIVKDLSTNVKGRHILVVEDTIDSGRTLAYLVDLFRYRKAASVRIAILLDKPESRVVDIKIDYVGLDVSDGFVVGCRLDYAETYRNLPYIGVLKSRVYESN